MIRIMGVDVMGDSGVDSSNCFNKLSLWLPTSQPAQFDQRTRESASRVSEVRSVLLQVINLKRAGKKWFGRTRSTFVDSKPPRDQIRSRVAAAKLAVGLVMESPDLVDELAGLARRVFGTIGTLLHKLECSLMAAPANSSTPGSAEASPPGNTPKPIWTAVYSEFCKDFLHFLEDIQRVKNFAGRRGNRQCVQEMCDDVLKRLHCLLGRADLSPGSGFPSGHAVVYQLSLRLLPLAYCHGRVTPKLFQDLLALVDECRRLPPGWNTQIFQSLSDERNSLLQAATKLQEDRKAEQLRPLREIERRILQALDKSRGTPLVQKEIGERVGVSRATVGRHLGPLEEDELVNTPRGDRSGYHITPKGINYLQQQEESRP